MLVRRIGGVLKNYHVLNAAKCPILTRHGESHALRYLLAGIVAFLVDFGMLAFFKEVLHWPVSIATAVAFLLSFFFTYTVQRTFAFGSDLPHGKAMIRYLILVGFNTLATTVLVSLISYTPLGWVGGKIVATGATTIWNYFVYKAWVFPPAEQPGASRKGENNSNV